ncbi:YecA family protein [Pseudoxanthomonas sangjuensis]|uniref:UPF0149 family protein n=1 Tax=Pseudoxanthomonas sangjuensis TaxID=1503750 RepID=UPI001390B969|nr:UPF0149 family protein [Pseudoxanthomonas sangjuensis]KAF1709181.1 YecA family protein [Pseudoxanthomonas sangjuensis]
MTELPELGDVVRSAQRLAPGVDPSELHGALSGWLAGGGADAADWPARVLADPALPAPEPGSALDELRTATVAQLEDRELGFELLLPDAAAPLGERATALFDWCRGFLGGFGLAAGAKPKLSDEGEEALRDLARLAQASAEQGDDEQEDEDALAEIEEFVRVAALLLHGDVVLAARHRQKLN